MNGKCSNGDSCETKDDCKTSESDESGGDEGAGGKSDESDESGGDEGAGGRSDSDENECIEGMCENGNTCRTKDDCKDPERFEYIKQTYEEYFPTTEASQSSPIILQTIPHYSFSNYYTLNKHNHHHVGPHHPISTHPGIHEHLPLEIPVTQANGFGLSPIRPPIPSENDLFQRLKSLPPISKQSTSTHNIPPTTQVVQGFTNPQTFSDPNVFNTNDVGTSKFFGESQSVTGNDLRAMFDANLAPKKYYSTTKQAKNLYPPKSHPTSVPTLPPSIPTGSIIHFEDYGIRLRQPKSYNPKFPTSVADKLPPISIKNHGSYGLHNNAPIDFHGPSPPSPHPIMFDLGNYGTDPDNILPHLLPPHMKIIKMNPQSFNVGYQSNDVGKSNQIKRPLVRFQYIHHIGPKKEQNTDAKDNSEEDYPAYKIPGPPYQHHTVPLEKQKKRKGKLFQFKNIVKRLLGR